MWSIISSLLSGLVGPLFTWLNKRVDADQQIHIVDVKTLGSLGEKGLDAVSKADALNADIRKSEGPWGPMTLFMLAVLAPLVWHLWQVCLDSSRWVPAIDFAWGFIPYPTVTEHLVGSWRIPPLPGAWEAVELSIFSSLFVGATAAIATVATVKAIGNVVRK